MHLIVLVVLVVWGFNAAASAKASSFCNTDSVRDYLAPIDRVSISPEFGEFGEIDVGPPSLRLFTQRYQLIPIGRGLFWAHGYVQNEKFSNRDVNWWVASYLEKVGRSGAARVVRTKRQFVERVRGFSREFGFSSKGVAPGLYRLTIRIENRSGRLLEKHQQAFRALAAKSGLRLAKSFESLAPGESGSIRIDNFGTIDAEFGANYRLWSANGEEVLVNPIFGNVGYILHGGGTSSCWRFTAPSDLTPGEYIIGSIARDDIKHTQLLTTSFVVN